jgi:hypothetical protein
MVSVIKFGKMNIRIFPDFRNLIQRSFDVGSERQSECTYFTGSVRIHTAHYTRTYGKFQFFLPSRNRNTEYVPHTVTQSYSLQSTGDNSTADDAMRSVRCDKM